MDYIAIKDIVRSVSQTHKFEKDYLKAVNTSDVLGGELFDVPYSETTSLKGQFKKTIQYNDILFSEIRPANRRFGRVNIKDTADYVVSTKLMVLHKFNDNVDLDYFYYCLTNQAFLEILQRRAENRIGSFPQITFDLLGNYEFPIPSLAEQKRIASVIANIDSKIRINQEINRNLEAMARQLYDYWFVQFDFPDDDGRPYKSSGGKMVWSEKLKREIPYGWEVKRIKDITEVLLGGTPDTSNENYWNGDIPWLNSGEVAEFPIIHSEKYITEEGMAKSATAYAPCGSVTLSITRHLRPSILAIDACINQSVVAIKETEYIRNAYLYPYLINEVPRLMSLRTGAQQPHINKEAVEESYILLNPKEVLQRYYRQATTLIDTIILNAKEIQSLTKQRDELLPLLMNGQVLVMQTEVNCDLSHD